MQNMKIIIIWSLKCKAFVRTLELEKPYKIKKERQTLISAPRAIIQVESSGHSEMCLFQSENEKISPLPITGNVSGAFLAHW